MAKTIGPDQFAAALGNAITGRHVRNLCERGLAGARKVGHRWRIDPVKAKAWIADPANAAYVANRIPLELGSSKDPAKPVIAEPVESIQSPAPARPPGSRRLSSVLEKRLDDMDGVAEVLLALLVKSGKFEPRAATMLKQTLSEIRQVEEHVLKMRNADARLMDRSRHRLIVGTIATRFRQEVESIATRWTEPVLAAITKSGLQFARPTKEDGKFEVDFPAAMRVVHATLIDLSATALFRLADDFERTDIDAVADQAAAADEGTTEGTDDDEQAEPVSPGRGFSDD